MTCDFRKLFAHPPKEVVIDDVLCQIVDPLGQDKSFVTFTSGNKCTLDSHLLPDTGDEVLTSIERREYDSFLVTFYFKLHPYLTVPATWPSNGDKHIEVTPLFSRTDNLPGDVQWKLTLTSTKTHLWALEARITLTT